MLLSGEPGTGKTLTSESGKQPSIYLSFVCVLCGGTQKEDLTNPRIP